MHYIIFDLEATCWESVSERRGNQEVIEIGAVKFNSRGEVVDEFEQFVKPSDFPALSDFCKNLTSITQEQIDNAPYFEEAMQNFRSWIGFDEDFILCSWGDWDKYHLMNEAKRKKLDVSWVLKHVNLKVQYQKLKMLRRGTGMKKTLLREKIDLTGTHHRGIDDARNIGKIFKRYFQYWRFRTESESRETDTWTEKLKAAH